MTRESDPKAAPQITAAKRDRGQITTNLAQRRAQRDAERLIRALREQIAGYDAGLIPFPVFACTCDVITSLMADIALTEELAS